MYVSLGSHLSANGTECYITSDMFYVEVQLDPTGLLCDVKVAHHGENPVVRITEKDKKNTFVFGTAVLLPFCLSQEKDYIEHSPKPNVVPLLLVLVEDQSSHGVICSCGLKSICASTILLIVSLFP